MKIVAPQPLTRAASQWNYTRRMGKPARNAKARCEQECAARTELAFWAVLIGNANIMNNEDSQWRYKNYNQLGS